MGSNLPPSPGSLSGSATVLALRPPPAFEFLFAFWPFGRSIAIGLGQLDDDEPVSPCRLQDEAAAPSTRGSPENAMTCLLMSPIRTPSARDVES